MNTTTVPNISFLKLSTVRKVFSLLRPAEKWIAGLFAFLVVVALYWNWHIFYTQHTANTPADGGTVTEGLVGAPELINPLLATTPVDEALVHALFSGLYRYDEHGTIIPDLATELPHISDDGKQYTVTLRPNLQWHDGAALTAADIAFTVEQIQNEATHSPHRTAWLSTTVQAVDDRTVIFTTKDVSGPFIHNLTTPLLPRHIWSTLAPTEYRQSVYNIKPIGSGPFAFEQYKKDPTGAISTLALKRVDNHPHTAHTERVIFSFFKDADTLEQAYINGDVQLVGGYAPDTSETITTNSTAQIVAYIAQYQAAFFNQSSPALQELSVRKALRIATDSVSITDTAWKGKNRPLAETPLGLMTTPAPAAAADITRANEILETAGWKRNAAGVRTKGGRELAVQLYTSNTASFQNAAEALARQWQQLGVLTDIHTLATADLITEHVRPRSYDILLFSQRSSADPDAFAFWHSSQSKDPGLNVANFLSNEADQLITEGRTTTNQEERQPIYNRLKGLLDTQVPAIYLNQSQYGYYAKGTIELPEIRALPDPSWRTSFLPDVYARTTRRWN